MFWESQNASLHHEGGDFCSQRSQKVSVPTINSVSNDKRTGTRQEKGRKTAHGQGSQAVEVCPVKFSKPSYEALRLRARKANRKLAEYIRESALNGEVVSGHNAETVAIAKKLIGMANNLNQLTKLSHQRGFHETHVYVVDLLRRLKEILGEYRQASYKPKPSSMGRKEDTI